MQAISTAQEYGPQAIQYAQEYGPQAISAWQNYGPQAIQYAQEYGPQAITYAQNYGPQAIQYAQEYGPQAIQAWQQYGNQLPEAITFAQQNAQYIPQVSAKPQNSKICILDKELGYWGGVKGSNEARNDVDDDMIDIDQVVTLDNLLLIRCRMVRTVTMIFSGDPVLANNCTDNWQLRVDDQNGLFVQKKVNKDDQDTKFVIFLSDWR